jgi:EAL domain-containing protein (putative c-di-GMP-specific phosphodiesterase class I)
VAVNLSARQFQRTDLSANIGHILADVGLDAQYLKLELTESSLIERPETVKATLQALRTMGVHLLIDDFGTGYSSLSHLKHFPIDTLKIDRSFVRGITANADDAAIVTATIAMAHSLHRTVIAEGVETKEQLAFLQAHGCDAIQGYAIGSPMPAAAFTQYLMEHPPAPLNVHNTGAHITATE